MNRILCGDALTVLREMKPSAFDGCLTDPPYGLEFMGKAWDRGVPPCEVWAEVLRVLKPGAFLLAFGGTRTHHRLMCALEDAGFEIRDCMMWIYGSGFPKSLDISKAIDKAAGAERVLGPKRVCADGTVRHDRAGTRHEGYEAPWRSNPAAVDRNTRVSYPATNAAAIWSGYGTALKPAWEPIIVAMKPCEGTFAENALKHGVAGLNIDASRIGTSKRVPGGLSLHKGTRCNGKYGLETGMEGGHDPNIGRWPANALLDETSAKILDEQSGDRSSTRAKGNPNNPVHQEIPSQLMSWGGIRETNDYRDSGGASRFFYCTKASRKERGEGNTHPTVKPLKLTEYLAKLILPPERDTPRRLLVPFAGSGSEIIGAKRAGWDRVTGIELNPSYVEMARLRQAA